MRYITNRLPAELSHPLTEPLSVRQYFNQFLESDELNWVKNTIYLGKQVAPKGAPLTIYFLPDWHMSTYTGRADQDEKSKRRQDWIIHTIQHRPLSLAFAEGNDGVMTWETRFEQNILLGKKNGLPVPTSLEKFKELTYARGLKEWTLPFLDDPNISIYGIDRELITKTEMILATLESPWPDFNTIISDTEKLSTYNFREEMILARCILEMRAHKTEDAYLILGQSHTPSFSVLCKAWGVRLTILAPPQ